MAAILIPLLVGILGAAGGLYLARMLNEHGSESFARVVQVTSLVILAAGVGRAAWLGLRDTSLPSPATAVSEGMTDLVDGMSSDQVSARCNGPFGAFADDAAHRGECQCIVTALESARASEPTLSMRVSQGGFLVDGSGSALLAFRMAYGRCVQPQLAAWVAADCRTGCQGDPGACATGCMCVGTAIVRGRNPTELRDLFWPHDAPLGASRDYGLHNAIVRAASSARCSEPPYAPATTTDVAMVHLRARPRRR